MYKDPKKAKEYRDKWNTVNKERRKINAHNYYMKHRDKWRINGNNWYRRKYKEFREKILNHYGNKCVCCGENRIEFLAIDHKYGGGTRERKNKKSRGGLSLWKFIVKNNFPEKYRILCHNCNQSLGIFGYCPHQIEKGELNRKDLLKIEKMRRERCFLENRKYM